MIVQHLWFVFNVFKTSLIYIVEKCEDVEHYILQLELNLLQGKPFNSAYYNVVKSSSRP